MKAKNSNIVPILIIILFFLKNSGFLLKIPRILRKIKIVVVLICFFVVTETVINVIEIYGYF